ncbi:MAG: hypothetical protein PHO07_12335 [Pirellulales bacterium]|jgi:hypothetical protein|nr:hypothetical protein [Thermoguttaceae bacterium]MDD4787954.1 hypothetical protein [Pirellulales bacterium]NLZ02602.1 hypothetical protein [Pirellulaceae bacterium]
MSRCAFCVLSGTVLLILAAARPAPGQQPGTGTEPAPAAENRPADPAISPAAEIGAEKSSSQGQDAEARPGADAQEPNQAAPKTPAPLRGEMLALRNQLRGNLARLYARPLNTRDHLPGEIIAFCQAFGHSAEILLGAGASRPVNAVGALCWNYPCGGYRLLRTDGSEIIARVGYGYQRRPGQFLAMLAGNGVPPAYEIRIGERKASVADLIAAEKAACLEGADLSGTLFGLAFYAELGETWRNAQGDAWSVERLVDEELGRSADPSSVAVIDRLAGLSFAIERLGDEAWTDAGLPARVKAHIAECQDFALRLQNNNGSWHPDFFARQGTSNNLAGSLRASGAILAWLASSLPEERLGDPRLIRSLQYVNQQIASRASSRTAAPASALDVLALMSGARAISLYDGRYFAPRIPPEPRSEQADPAPSTAAR